MTPLLFVAALLPAIAVMSYVYKKDKAEPEPIALVMRVFGLGDGEKPAVPAFTARRVSGLDMLVRIAPQGNTLGYNIHFGAGPEKLYHSYMVFGSEETRVGALIEGRKYYVRVDAFNENGITKGELKQV